MIRWAEISAEKVVTVIEATEGFDPNTGTTGRFIRLDEENVYAGQPYDPETGTFGPLPSDRAHDLFRQAFNATRERLFTETNWVRERHTDRLELGIFDLKQGGNTLVVEIIGANEKAIKKHMFGLDYLQLTPAP